MRVVADWDPDRSRELFAWALRDLLSSYLAIMRRQAEERYKFDLEVWAMLAPHQEKASSPPKLPRILRS